MTESIYNSFIQTKNDSTIPILTNGKTVESRYNPQNDALRTLESYSQGNFFIVIGIASGILIFLLKEKFSFAKIICIEKSQNDITFLKQLKLVDDLSKSQNIIFTDIENLQTVIEQNYIPSFYGNLQIIEQRGWILENHDATKQIQQKIQNALFTITKDFSVQSHFGKIWQSNILNNLNFLSKNKLEMPEINCSKEAVVLAAGPSLDSKISLLKENRDKYYLIATDTAYSSLQKQNIFCDCVVSIDGQNISHTHFLNDYSDISRTLFIFDLCSNNSIVQFIHNKKGKILFSNSGHPLSEYASLFYKNFIQLYTGSGTVTIAALDFALKAGFNKVHVFGADFSYPDNKPYTKGTYLDGLYLTENNRLSSFENSFCNLMYRTELIQKNKFKTTEVLESYRKSFEDFINSLSLSFTKSDQIYTIQNKQNPQKLFNQISSNLFDFTAFLQKFRQEKSNIDKKNTFFDLTHEDISLLPLISWLRTIDDNNKRDFKYLLNLSYTTILR